MKLYFVSYIATAIVFLGLDAVWLTVMGGLLYRPVLGDLLLPTFSPVPALIFYLLYIGGIVIFAISPAVATGNWFGALTTGALFGFFAYATYDLTNQATLKRWSTLLSIVDMTWGTVATGVAAALGVVITTAAMRWLGP